jgi:hypothetical protein
VALILANDILYLHIPKTGGNWMTKILSEQNLVRGRLGSKHATWDAICEQRHYGLRREIDRFRWALGPSRSGRIAVRPRVVCVVRHPLAWYESWFRYSVGRNWPAFGEQGNLQDWHVNSDMAQAASEDFNEFVRKVNAHRPGYVSQLFARYTYNSGAHVLKNESLADDLIDFLTDAGVSFDAEAIRQSGRHGESPKIALHWEADVLDETVAFEQPAFRHYGYTVDRSIS